MAGEPRRKRYRVRVRETHGDRYDIIADSREEAEAEALRRYKADKHHIIGFIVSRVHDTPRD